MSHDYLDRRHFSDKSQADYLWNLLLRTPFLLPQKCPAPVRYKAQTDTDSLNWFREHYRQLQDDIAAERQQWAEETLGSKTDVGIETTVFPSYR